MVHSIGQSLDFLFALSNFTIKLITISLQFLSFLSSFDNIVSLRVLAWSFNLPVTGLISLNKTFIFDTQVFDSCVSVLKLNGYLVTFFLSSFLLRNKDIFVHLDFLLTLLHTHLKLIFTVFKSINLVGLFIDYITEPLDFELHDFVLYKSFLFFLGYLTQVSVSHFVLKSEFLIDSVETFLLLLDYFDTSLHVSFLILELLVGSSQKVQLNLLFLYVLLSFTDVSLKFTLLLL
mmetsp:Transcript_28651/g.20714  ORF Transcript_28651/g.20714 Transcript_28651/m.20714 type:complete len:233 (-) Transcript_28651:1478-2176(-)